jgi:two-component system OmpR family response regulator
LASNLLHPSLRKGCRQTKEVAAMNRLLHVEDEPDIQVVAKLALEAVGGFTLETASSGREALSKALSFAPELILLDVMMPGMDGPATLRELRNFPGSCDIPVIFMTAKVQSQEVEKYKSMGAIGVIAKPFDPMTLADEVRKVFAESQAGQGIFRAPSPEHALPCLAENDGGLRRTG